MSCLASGRTEFHTDCSIKPLISVWAEEKTSRADTKTLHHLQVSLLWGTTGGSYPRGSLFNVLLPQIILFE